MDTEVIHNLLEYATQNARRKMSCVEVWDITLVSEPREALHGQLSVQYMCVILIITLMLH